MTGSTPVYGIRYPDQATKLKALGGELAQMGGDIERALQTAAIPPVSNPQIVTAPSAAARDQYWGVPATEADRLTLQAKGAQTVRTDLGTTEQYFATYDATTNPVGRTPAGWYRVAGALYHAEFTAQLTAVAEGGPVQIGVLAPDAAMTPRAGFATPGASGVLTLQAGLYAISFFMAFVMSDGTTAQPATGRTFIDVQNAAGVPLARANMVPPEDKVLVGVPNLYMPSSGSVRFALYKTTGGSLGYARSRIRVTQLY